MLLGLSLIGTMIYLARDLKVLFRSQFLINTNLFSHFTELHSTLLDIFWKSETNLLQPVGLNTVWIEKEVNIFLQNSVWISNDSYTAKES